MSAHSVRVVLIPLEASRSRALVLVLTLVAAAVLAAAIVGPAVAGYLADRATTLGALEHAVAWDPRDPDLHLRLGHSYASLAEGPDYERARLDRKSTRLNSSHDQISYAVFCLKKKKKLDTVVLTMLIPAYCHASTGDQ